MRAGPSSFLITICAVGRDSCPPNLSPVTSAYQRIICNNSYAHEEQRDNPGQEKEGLTMSYIN